MINLRLSSALFDKPSGYAEQKYTFMSPFSEGSGSSRGRYDGTLPLDWTRKCTDEVIFPLDGSGDGCGSGSSKGQYNGAGNGAGLDDFSTSGHGLGDGSAELTDMRFAEWNDGRGFGYGDGSGSAYKNGQGDG